jgi:hypothetical protein
VLQAQMKYLASWVVLLFRRRIFHDRTQGLMSLTAQLAKVKIVIDFYQFSGEIANFL